VTDIPVAFSPSESAELLALAEEIGRVGVIDWQVQTGTVRLSPNALAIYGLKEFDGRYETWIATVYREDLIRVRDTIATVFAAKVREFELDFRIVRQSDNELRWIQARRLAFYDETGKAFRVVGVSVDITERKRELVTLRNFTEALEIAVKERTRELVAENEARQEAEALLRQAQKMEAVGQLTGGVAHDFNNLLTIILGWLDIIGRRIPDLEASPATERIARAKDMASQGAHRAVELTNRLLAFSRQQPLEPKALDANKLVAGVSELLRRTLGETVSLESVLAGGLWRTHADHNQLENALLNLALNARDAMPNGGKMTIETANSYLDDAYVSSLPEPIPSGQYVLIAVADNGVGIDPSKLERVFDPFFTTKEVGKGTGLGLSQVYGFVRQSAGHVKIYSELGQGTTIKIYLPRYFGNEQHVEEQLVRGMTPRAIGTESILVVEDDEALCAYAIETLSELGYRVLGASNGATALGILDREQNVDLLFTDIVMPGGVNGRELAEEAVRRHPGLKVLFTTGYTRNAIIHHGRLDPGVHLINKPFSLEELGRRVRALLDGAEL
jgi:signal transduction histidine kinase/CheY-like chemotaxis protein